MNMKHKKLLNGLESYGVPVDVSSAYPDAIGLKFNNDTYYLRFIADEQAKTWTVLINVQGREIELNLTRGTYYRHKKIIFNLFDKW